MSATPSTEAPPYSFGERLLLLRRRVNLSQERLGEQVGLSKSAISKLERGEREPTREVIVALCGVLGTNPNYLLGFSVSPSSLTRAA